MTKKSLLNVVFAFVPTDDSHLGIFRMRHKWPVLAGLILVLSTQVVLVTSSRAQTDSNAPKLPPLTSDPVWRLRGAQLFHGPDWSDPDIPEWDRVDRFPAWGGNAFRIFLEPSLDGETILPGEPLTLKLSEALNRWATVIDWALQNDIYVVVAFNPYVWNADDWPDDGRSLWKDESARVELVQAWADLAKRFKGIDGLIFDLVNEPHGTTADEINGNHALPKQVWNDLYPRLIDAIRAEDPNRWIVVTPIWGQPSNFVDLAVSTAPKLIYTFHFYDPHFFTHQGIGSSWPPAESVSYPGTTRDAIWEPERFWDKSVLEERLRPAINFRDSHQVRVLCGEYGSNAFAPEDSQARWTTDVIDLLEQYGFDHLYFLYGATGRVWPGSFQFELTSFESVVTSAFALNLDTDADGIPDGTDTDDDNDGVPDASDAFPEDSTESVDTDGDGIGDNADNCPDVTNPDQLGTDNDELGDVCDPDDDNDSLPDEFEITNNLNPLDASDADLDNDADGLSNLQEFELGTNVNNPDTDNDGVDDGEEVMAGTNPNVHTNAPALMQIIDSILQGDN
jgi:hypothetical protein